MAVSADEEYSGFTHADFGCPDQSGNDCTFIDKITPSGTVTPGTVTPLHTFETDGFGNNGGAPNTDGFGPTPLVEGPHGYLYRSANSGGSAGYGTIFKISTAGVFTVLFTFPNTGTALDPVAPDGTYPSRLIFGKDRNLYGTSQHSLHPSKSLSLRKILIRIFRSLSTGVCSMRFPIPFNSVTAHSLADQVTG